MTKPYQITFTAHRGKNFDDYILQLTGIFVCLSNTILISEELNAPNTKFSSGGFNLFGNGYGGYEITFRIEKQPSKFSESEIVKFIDNGIAKIYGRLKSA